MLIKVCCIQDDAELRLAARAGATHVGLVGAMPSGPGPLADDDIARLAASAPDAVTTVLLTSRTASADIIEHVRATGTGAVQIVQAVPADVRREVRAALPGVEVLQVLHVVGPQSIEAAPTAAEAADYLLLDSGRPDAETPQLGGTGRVHDWLLSAEIVSRVAVPVFLAGGLRPSNVLEAIETVGPAGVDVCSGLRRHDQRLVDEQLLEFVAAARGA